MSRLDDSIPSLSIFTPAERRLIRRLDTPERVQAWLNALPYNAETSGGTLRGFREVARRRTAHCLEAALFAAAVLQQHGFPPLTLELGSIDGLDHVIFIYRRNGRWGSVARSRDPGLHGRKPVFRTLRALAMSYFEPYVDYTGVLTGFARVDLRGLGRYDWRFQSRNMWAVERFLLAAPQIPIRSSAARVGKLRQRYVDYRTAHHGRKPLYYQGREHWLPIPKQFL
jgi:hypothetical protein